MDHENIPAATVLLRSVMTKLGIKRITGDSIELIINVYYDLDAMERRDVRNALVVLGHDRTAEVLQKAPEDGYNDVGFSCPELKTRIVSPCELDVCRYHIDRAQDHNCLLVSSGKEELTPIQVADILGYTQDQVKDISLRAMRIMRESTVKVAQEKSELRAEFTFLKNRNVCGVCECAVDGEPFYTEGNVSFCSSECINKRDPAEVILEARYGVPIKKLVEWVTTNFDTIEAAAQSLGYPSAVLTRVLG